MRKGRYLFGMVEGMEGKSTAAIQELKNCHTGVAYSRSQARCMRSDYVLGRVRRKLEVAYGHPKGMGGEAKANAAESDEAKLLLIHLCFTIHHQPHHNNPHHHPQGTQRSMCA